MFFRYKCISDDGSKIEGIIEAKDIHSATIELKSMFPVVLDVREEKVVKKNRRISKKDLITFTNIISISVNAGVSIIKALELVGSSIRDKAFKEVIDMVIYSVRGGKLFSEALSLHPDVFDSLYVSIVKAGESSGNLGEALKNLSEYLERSFNISSRIKSALVYPLIILGVALGVVLLFLTSIVPKFSEIYSSYGTELPEITKITIYFGNIVKDNFLYIFASIISLVFAFGYLYNNSTNFKDLFQRFVVKTVPFLGNFMVKADIEKFSRVMSILLSSRVMVLDALEISSNVVDLVFIKRALNFVTFEVEKGRLLSESISDYPFFPILLIQMLKVGEETGEIDLTLKKMADFYSFELERESEILVSSLSPILIVLVGFIVAFLVISLFMPMFSLQQILIR
ncbi:MAG: type II secretion system F family protein [Brevinematia bacterium]